MNDNTRLVSPWSNRKMGWTGLCCVTEEISMQENNMYATNGFAPELRWKQFETPEGSINSAICFFNTVWKPYWIGHGGSAVSVSVYVVVHLGFHMCLLVWLKALKHAWMRNCTCSVHFEYDCCVCEIGEDWEHGRETFISSSDPRLNPWWCQRAQ